MGDSLVKYIGNWESKKDETTYKILTKCLCGCNTTRLFHKIRTNKIEIKEWMIICIGTNDIEETSRFCLFLLTLFSHCTYDIGGGGGARVDNLPSESYNNVIYAV